ncbi:MAG: primosomal protein N' [Cytophagaceae bacterium]
MFGISHTDNFLYADVLLPLPLPKPFTYRVPEVHHSTILKGSRVVVQFGKKRILTGIVVDIHTRSPEVYEPKEIIELLDDTPVVNTFQLQLFEWMSDYYLCSQGEILQAALPSGLKLSSQSKIQLNPERKDNIPVTEKEEAVLEALKNKGSLSYDEVAAVAGKKNIHPLVKSLIQKGFVLLFEELKEKYSPKTIRRIRLNSSIAGSNAELQHIFKSLEKNQKQTDVLLKYISLVNFRKDPLANNHGLDKNRLSGIVDSSSALNTLIKKGIFEEFEVIVSRFADLPEYPNHEINLSKEQEAAKNQILNYFQEKDAVLLHGITGSGKTEIFIELIRHALQGGSQVLYLLPEIALTTQIVSRLRKVFGDKMGVYHSKFSDNERVETWKGVISGKFSFVVGVRSSIFLPFDNLGLIIIDEEHEPSYKQQDPAPRYHARDTALMLARIHNAKSILGSATPSIESYHNSKEGKWGLVTLNSRFGSASLPDMIKVDIRKERKEKKNKNDFSSVMVQMLDETVSQKEQAILFQNRRGYAPYLCCEECAYIPKCEQCSVSMTYHLYSKELRCHYCGNHEKIPSYCEACGASALKTVGFGTEKLEDDLKLLFPDFTVKRMDLDTTRSKTGYQKIINEFESGETDVLIGTQMVTKGLDFDKVSMVGIMDADAMINFPDFRSHERAYQTIIQVSGRAGRRDKKGKVIIQTSNTETPLLYHIMNNDYTAFFDKEINERHKYFYPPFSRLIKITVKDADKTKAEINCHKIFSKLAPYIPKDKILGPEVPLISKIRNLYLVNLYLKLPKGGQKLTELKKFIRQETELLKTQKDYTSQIVIDVDPY